MISSSDSGISSNISSLSTILCFSLLTTSTKSSINVSRSICLIDGPKPSHYINNTDEEESIIGLPSEGQEDSWLDLGKPLLEEEVRRAIVEEIRRHVFNSELGRETLEDEGVAKKAEKVFVPPQTKSFSPNKKTVSVIGKDPETNKLQNNHLKWLIC